MKKFLKNLLMKRLIDIVINQDFNKLEFNRYLLYLNTLNHIFNGKFRLKSIN